MTKSDSSRAVVISAECTVHQSQNIAQRKADIVAAEAKVEQARAAYQLSFGTAAALSTIGNSGAASKSEQDKAFADTQNNLALLQQAQANVLVAKEALKTAQVAEQDSKHK